MSNYRPDLKNPIPLVLLVPTYTYVSGVNKKTIPTIEEALTTKDGNGNPLNLFFGSFRTYGGTEMEENGLYSIIDTARVETWYRPDIKSDCHIGVIQTGAIYEILNEPENIEMRNQFLKFKVRRVKGGA